jgi:hypothetical protein
VNEQCNVEIQIGSYKDEILCDIMPMDVFHVLLGRPWKYDRKSIHDGRKNTYSLKRMGTSMYCFLCRMKEPKRKLVQVYC